MESRLYKAIVVSIVVVPLLAAPSSLAQDRQDTPLETIEGAIPGRVSPTGSTAPLELSDDPAEGSSQDDDSSYIAPPINPLPSYYELHKMRTPGFGNIGIAPPINPFPRVTINRDMLTRNMSTPTSTQVPSPTDKATPQR